MLNSKNVKLTFGCRALSNIQKQNIFFLITIIPLFTSATVLCNYRWRFWFLIFDFIWRLRFEIFMASTWSIFYYKFIYAWIFYSISEFLLQEAVKAWIFSQISPFSTFVRVNLCHLFGYCNDSSKGLYKQKNSWIGKRKAHWIYLWEQKLGKVDYLRGQRIRYIWIPATSFYIRSISGALTSSPWKSH